MTVLSEEYLFTRDVMSYVQEKHNRHWSRMNIYMAIMRKRLPVFSRVGRQNIYKVEDIDKYISTLKRSSSSGVKGVKYKKNS